MTAATVELSGFHAVKHALRFGAADLAIWTEDRQRAVEICERLAPDVRDAFVLVLEELDRDAFAALSDYRHPTRVLGRATQPTHALEDAATSSDRPIIHLDGPVDPGNVGAVIRVAAAVGAAAVVTTGFDQLWQPACVRGSAGLHFALPVVAADPAVRPSGRPLVAFDPGGEDFVPETLDPGSWLAFGSERDGLSGEVLGAADRVVRLPMATGVSSLNLATSVAAATYALSLAR